MIWAHLGRTPTTGSHITEGKWKYAWDSLEFVSIHFIGRKKDELVPHPP